MSVKAENKITLKIEPNKEISASRKWHDTDKKQITEKNSYSVINWAPEIWLRENKCEE